MHIFNEPQCCFSIALAYMSQSTLCSKRKWLQKVFFDYCINCWWTYGWPHGWMVPYNMSHLRSTYEIRKIIYMSDGNSLLNVWKSCQIFTGPASKIYSIINSMVSKLFTTVPQTQVLRHWYQVIFHDDVAKWKHFPRYWSFHGVRGIHRWPVDFSHKGQWHVALMFSLMCAWTKG